MKRSWIASHRNRDRPNPFALSYPFQVAVGVPDERDVPPLGCQEPQIATVESSR